MGESHVVVTLQEAAEASEEFIREFHGVERVSKHEFSGILLEEI
jgi:hypothetical protein